MIGCTECLCYYQSCVATEVTSAHRFRLPTAFELSRQSSAGEFDIDHDSCIVVGGDAVEQHAGELFDAFASRCGRRPLCVRDWE